MENVFEISLLLDFYGLLLTARQYEIMDLHYNNDYSLGEIAEQLNISRQGVYDNIKRGKTVLNEMENKLGLVKKFSEQKVKAENILQTVKKINSDNLQETDKERIRMIEEEIMAIINMI